jgi:hypothetical protein
MAALRQPLRATHHFDLRHRAKHRIKIVMQALDIQRMRALFRALESC